jgi:hypothetical protein
MLRIIHWRYPGKIFQLHPVSSDFFKETGIGISRIYIAVGIYPGLVKIRGSCYRIRFHVYLEIPVLEPGHRI